MSVYGTIVNYQSVDSAKLIEYNKKIAPYYKLEGTNAFFYSFDFSYFCSICQTYRIISLEPELMMYNRAPACYECGKLCPIALTEFSSIQSDWLVKGKFKKGAYRNFRRSINNSIKYYLQAFVVDSQYQRDKYTGKNSVKNYLEYPKKSKIERTKFLRSIEGWYTSEKTSLDMLVEASGLGDLPKYLKKTVPGIDERMIKEVVDKNSGVKFKLSTKYNDILRCSKTKHFDSCLNPKGCNKNAPRLYLKCKDVAVIFVPDSKGDFLARVFAVANGKQLILLRKYGNANWEKMLETLRKNKIEAKWAKGNDNEYLNQVFGVAYFDAGY